MWEADLSNWERVHGKIAIWRLCVRNRRRKRSWDWDNPSVLKLWTLFCVCVTQDLYNGVEVTQAPAVVANKQASASYMALITNKSTFISMCIITHWPLPFSPHAEKSHKFFHLLRVFFKHIKCGNETGLDVENVGFVFFLNFSQKQLRLNFRKAVLICCYISWMFKVVCVKRQIFSINWGVSLV